MKNFMIEISVEVENEKEANDCMNYICDGLEGVFKYLVADYKEIPVITLSDLKALISKKGDV